MRFLWNDVIDPVKLSCFDIAKQRKVQSFIVVGKIVVRLHVQGTWICLSHCHAITIRYVYLNHFSKTIVSKLRLLPKPSRFYRRRSVLQATRCRRWRRTCCVSTAWSNVHTRSARGSCCTIRASSKKHVASYTSSLHGYWCYEYDFLVRV